MTPREILEKALGYKLPDPVGDNPNVLIHCFHHEDTDHKSCSVDLERGMWYCHASNEGGTLVTALAYILKISNSEAKKRIENEGIVVETVKRERVEKPPIDPEIAAVYVRGLINDPDARELARKKFGWHDATLKRFGIGLDPKTRRYAIPVKDAEGNIRNIRLYHPDRPGVDKMISWAEGYGQGRIYPLDLLADAHTVILCEGEKDCILMNQILEDNGVEGWVAVTGTGGAGTWKDEWSSLFKGKDVIVIYDIDDAGKSQGSRVASKLLPHATRVKQVVLDIAEPKNADITNYFVDSSKGWEDLQRLIEGTDFFSTRTKRFRSAGQKDTEVYRPHLSIASQEKFLYRKTEIAVVMAGKDLAPFAVPKKVTFECDMALGGACNVCSMMARNGVSDVSIADDDPDILHMIRVTDQVQMGVIKTKEGINRKCPRVSSEVTEFYNVEEVTVVPELDFSDSDREYVSRTAYVMGHGATTNTPYVMEGTAVAHPKTQHVVHHVQKLARSQDSISDFSIDEKKVQRLSAFRPKPGQTVREKIDEIARDLELNVTKIYGRPDIIIGVDLCFHTVSAMRFLDKPVAKAWGDILIIGDTRTGKSETVAAMIGHYRLGEFTVAENASFAGLVGGLRQEAGKRWSIVWGKIPLNDRRLLAIDETSGLSKDAIGAMSGIRSNGLAEIDKIMTQRTHARTRLIWISNPRSTKSMSQYSHGVEAIRELIGRPEDIARFDFVMSAATNEVPIEVINSAHHDTVEHVYTSDLCRQLVLWAWSRREEDVVFTPDAQQAVLDLAISQSGRYASEGGIPLVEGGNHRIKLAKLAAAVAVRVFSSSPDGEKVIVGKEHVEYAAEFLDSIYSKPSLDYEGWSETILAKRAIPDALLNDVKDWIRNHQAYADLWLSNTELRVEDFRNQFNLDPGDARKIIFQRLTQMRMITRSFKGGFTKTPGFIRCLKEVKTELGGFNITIGTVEDNGHSDNGMFNGDDDIPF